MSNDLTGISRHASSVKPSARILGSPLRILAIKEGVRFPALASSLEAK